MSALTPEQSADVIRYYHRADNEKPAQNGWKLKTTIGESAVHAAMSRMSILPNNKPLLTHAELSDGLEEIQNPSLSDEEVKKMDGLIDSGAMNPYQARQAVLDRRK